MKVMNCALFGSTGAALMSAFHQFAGGKRGSGVGRSPPLRASCGATARMTASATPIMREGSGNRRPVARRLEAVACGLGSPSAAGIFHTRLVCLELLLQALV